MRILFLLSCLEPAGSETYCVALERAWKNKHKVFWISDQLHYGQTYESMPIHMKPFPVGYMNVRRVAEFIRANGIQIIHSHSRRANWVAAAAAKKARIPHIATVHQPLPVHFFSKLQPCLGDHTIAIDEAIVDHLQRNFRHPLERIHLVRNGIDLNASVPALRQAPGVKDILLIGRLSGGRWKAFEFFLDTLLRCHSRLPPAHYKIIGQVPFERRDELTRRLSMARSTLAPSTIESLGYVQDLALIMRNADGAVGAGRSALECMANGRPVILLGEGGVLGLCKPAVWTLALRTNLGDHLEPKSFDTSKLEAGLREILAARTEDQTLGRYSREFVEKFYDLRQVAPAVEAVYIKALAK